MQNMTKWFIKGHSRISTTDSRTSIIRGTHLESLADRASNPSLYGRELDLSVLMFKRGLDLEIARVHNVIQNTIAQLEDQLQSSVFHALAKLTQPFHQNSTSLYTHRAFLLKYMDDRTDILSTSTPHLSLDAYLASLQNDAHSLPTSQSLDHLVQYEEAIISFIKYVSSATSQLDYSLKQYNKLLSNKDLSSIIADHAQISSNLSYISTSQHADPYDTISLAVSLVDLSTLASDCITENMNAISELLMVLCPERDDYLCVICLDLKYRPVLIGTCKHQYCLPCLQEYQRHQSTCFYLDSPVCACPLCRSSYLIGASRSDLIMDPAMSNMLKAYFPTESKGRAREERLRDAHVYWRKLKIRGRRRFLRIFCRNRYYYY
ncbi:hypothetical protein SeLEV6574_g03354 [Synchytrium endobioticum]|uniref:RING-type domain-containing protein n=1 Tax=Synchytrium endobioticum TaxID=286115 RepID=A0A507D4C2_9FUNG|nr:hypothetical protein SeLEV6574_g03354 [Synchytrium endobioticum]